MIFVQSQAMNSQMQGITFQGGTVLRAVRLIHSLRLKPLLSPCLLGNLLLKLLLISRHCVRRVGTSGQGPWPAKSICWFAPS